MSDQKLWRRLKSGDSRALENIYRQHVHALIDYGSRFTPDTPLVEDAIQDLFIEIWKNKKTVGDTDSIIRYLLVSLRRKLFRMLKKKSRVSTDEIPFQLDATIESDWIKTEMQIERNEKLRLALEQLSKKQKEAIYLKYEMDMSYEEICQVLDINYQSVRNLVSRGIKSIRNHMLSCLFVINIL